MLEALSIPDDGKLNYTTFLEVLAVAKKDPYAKTILVRFVEENFRDDLRRLLTSKLEFVELRLDQRLRGVPAGPSQGQASKDGGHHQILPQPLQEIPQGEEAHTQASGGGRGA